MVIPSVGLIVLVPFPFSNLSQAKLRPAVVLAAAGKNDWILCQITSKPFGDPRSIQIGEDSFQKGSLRLTSYARPGKLFTANSALMIKDIALLRDPVKEGIIAAVIQILRGN